MRLSLEAGIKEIRTYTKSSIDYPFFVAVDGSREMARLAETLPTTYLPIYVSASCAKDGFPDYDHLFSVIKDCESNVLLLGLGECAMLSQDYSFFNRLRDCSFSHKVVALVRNSAVKCAQMKQGNSKFGSMRWCEIDSTMDISAVRVMPEVQIDAIDGFKALLNRFESFYSGKLYVRTALDLKHTPIIENAYDALCEESPTFSISEDRLTAEQWEQYRQDANLDEYPLESWRTYLRLLISETDSPYLRLVMRYSPTYAEYKHSLLCAILHLDYTGDNFQAYYDERKDLLCMWQELDVQLFIEETRAKGKNRIYYLTDNTLAERHAIIEELARISTVPDELTWIYPDLAAYLSFYRFTGEYGEVLTDYFERYKRQKVLNKIEPQFLEWVTELSKPGERLYNKLLPRTTQIMPYKNPNVGLFWLDGLGVEYLAFIQQKAKSLNLQIHFEISRSFLPTLTCYNREFYDQWPGPKEPRWWRLDRLKHEGTGEAGIKSTDPAIHLANELDVITKTLQQIRKLLENHSAQRILLVSDHGASRLCVLNQKENKWTMSEKGKHSGRCCVVSDADEQPESATEAHDLWVLANYDRFQGGMPANVEVHGGATLEEVIVPIIVIELVSNEISCRIITQDDSDPAILEKPLDGDIVLPLYCSNHGAHLSARIEGVDYLGTYNLENPGIFCVLLPRQQFVVGKTYDVTIFDGDNELRVVRFILRRKEKLEKRTDGMEFFE